MFKINIYLKFALIAIFLIGGLILSFTVGFWYAFPLILIGLFFLASYFLLGTIVSSGEYIQAQQFDLAEKQLALTKFPRLLYISNRAMYYILKGTIYMHRNDHNEAELLFNQALDMKMPTDDQRAMVLLQLANIKAVKGKWNAAQIHMRELKKLAPKTREIKEQVEMFEKAMKNRGQVQAANRGGGQQVHRGGKRRRPKMR